MKILLDFANPILNTFYHHKKVQSECWHALYAKPIRIRMTDCPVDVVLTITEDNLFLEPYASHQPHLSISAPSTELLAILLGRNHSSDTIIIQGPADLANLFKSFVRQHDIDWESLFSSVIGPAAAYALWSQSQSFSKWFKKSIDKTHHSAGTFIQEECQLTPTRREVADFLDEVDVLAEKIDRLISKYNKAGFP